MPQDHVRGHFKILPCEIFQVASKPSALSSGISRATQRLATLVRDGVESTSRSSCTNGAEDCPRPKP
jgi:hypothetical protein